MEVLLLWAHDSTFMSGFLVLVPVRFVPAVAIVFTAVIGQGLWGVRNPKEYDWQLSA